MMGVIGVQISKGLITGEPFEILAGSMVFNIMAWFSSLQCCFIFSPMFLGANEKADLRAEQQALTLLSAEETEQDDEDIIEHPNCHTS